MPEDGKKLALDQDAFIAGLAQIVGSDNVRRDPAALSLASSDIWAPGRGSLLAVVYPGSLEELSRSVAAISAAGLPIAPRGAGMSYTGGYVPVVQDTVSLDLSRMNRILEIRPEDMTVTVEAGCSWSALLAALTPLGLRTPFWGPMSGLVSTIGGGLSQLNAMLGGGRYGTSSESVIALSMVLADGRILRTGARGEGGDAPFYRHFGPDLAGLFCGDAGIFGIKGEITLRLIRAPAHEDYASFSFKTGEALLRAMAELSRAGVACEMCAFDPGLTKVRLARASLAGDVKTVGAVIKRQKNFLRGLLEAGKMARGGRSFIEVDEYPLHVICEGRSAAGVAADLAAARRIAATEGGVEIENTIAKVIRAVPFPPLNSVLGPAGERWAPVHGLVPLSQAPAIFAELQIFFAARAGQFAEAGISTGYLFTGVSTNALIIEPVFYWPEQRFAVHEVAIEPAHLAKLPTIAANPAATAIVAAARAEVISIFARHGCSFYQIGRTYPYMQSRDAATGDLLEAVKFVVDPAGIFNPGGLGLAAPKQVVRET
jgi:FAD/FMN-containing dehydrogenase